MKRLFWKAIGGLTVICILLFGVVPSFAMDENAMYTEIAVYTATVYVCDSAERTIVLKDVETSRTDHVAQTIKTAIEYTETPVTHRGLRDKSGQLMSLENINETCLDQQAKVLVARNGYGCTVVWLHML